MGVLVDELKHTNIALVVANNEIVGSRVDAHGRQFHFSGAAVALLALELEGLVEAFRNINVGEGPSVTVVPP